MEDYDGHQYDMPWYWEILVIVLLLVFWLCPVVAFAAPNTKYIDNRLTTGSNNGSSAANAFRSIEDYRAAVAGTNVDLAIFVAGSGPYREAFGSRTTRYKTDLSFSTVDMSINAASTNLSSFGFQVGDIVRIFGTTTNSGRQYQIATIAAGKITFLATNTVIQESAGAKVMMTTINNGSNLAGLDPGANGLVTAPTRWMMNGVEIDAGVTLTSAYGFTWTQSVTKPGEWYVKRSDGSNPSLLQPFCAVIAGAYISDSADLDPDMGTVGSLSTTSPMGWGDNDSIGYNTVYVLSTVNPEASTIRVGQLAAGVSINWQYHSFEDGVFSLGNRDSGNNAARGVAIANRGTTTWWVKRCVMKYQSSHAVEQATFSGGVTHVESSVTYFSGHRGYALTGDGTLNVYNSLDYGAHLFALISTGVTSAGRLVLRNNVSTYNEAGAIDKKSATAVLVEDHNTWYPRFGASGNALGYVSTANWTTTAATDHPPSAATTISTEATNLSAGAVDPSLRNPALMASVSSPDVTGLQPTAAALRRTGKTIFHVIGKDGKRFNLAAFDRGPWASSVR